MHVVQLRSFIFKEEYLETFTLQKKTKLIKWETHLMIVLFKFMLSWVFNVLCNISHPQIHI